MDWAASEAVMGEGGLPISPVQCRMARAGLVISVREFARLAEVSGLAVTRFENGNTDCPEETVRRFRQILESRGARFQPPSDGNGVRIVE